MRLLAVFRCRGVDFLQKQIRCKEKCLYLQNILNGRHTVSKGIAQRVLTISALIVKKVGFFFELYGTLGKTRQHENTFQ